MRKIKIIFCTIFILIISFFGITTIRNNNEISTLEGRELTTFPKISIKSLISDDYFNTLTEAFSDQLEFRNYLVKGYYLFQFQRYNGDVVKGNNNELYSSIQTISSSYYDELEEVTGLINEVSDEVNNAGSKFIFLSIPRKDAVMTDDLPKSYISSNTIYEESVNVIKSNLNDNIYFIDAYDIFNNSDFDCYYSNDHHITPRAGLLLYSYIINYVNEYDNVPLYDISYYDIEKKVVNGSFSRQIGGITNDEEELVLIPKYNIDYTRYEDGKISNKKILNNSNNYAECYMEGDNPFTIVDTHRNELPNIMYVGSSYTNILESISVPSFNKMISIDYRHNTTGKSISDYVKEYDIDYVVFVPSQSNNAFSIDKIITHLGK